MTPQDISEALDVPELRLFVRKFSNRGYSKRVVVTQANRFSEEILNRVMGE